MNAKHSSDDRLERPPYEEYDIEAVHPGWLAAVMRFLRGRPTCDLAIIALCVIARWLISAGAALTTQTLIGASVCAVLIFAVAVITICREDNAHGASKRPKDKTQTSQPGRGDLDDEADRPPP